MVAITHHRPGVLLPLAARPVPPEVYRRRRLAVIGALAVLLALAVAFAAGRTVAPATGGAAPLPAAPVVERSVVVEPGDTVWSIAEELAPGADPRPFVDAIVAANGGADLIAGQRLTLRVP